MYEASWSKKIHLTVKSVASVNILFYLQSCHRKAGPALIYVNVLTYISGRLMRFDFFSHIIKNATLPAKSDVKGDYNVTCVLFVVLQNRIVKMKEQMIYY